MTPKFRSRCISFWVHWEWLLPLSLLSWMTEPVQEKWRKQVMTWEGGAYESVFCCVHLQRQSGMSRESPCTPSSWCRPACIDVPALRPQPDTLPRSLWTQAPSSPPTPWLNRRAPGQESWRRTPVLSRGAGCEKTPTCNDQERQKK